MAKFTEVSGPQIKKTLARRLVPLADSLRNMLTTFGLRTYKVSVMRVKWSGGRRGIGFPSVTKQTVILPTPRISDLNALTEIVQPIGLDEIGNILLEGISGRYTEEELRGLDFYGEEIPPDDEVYYEIEFPRIDNGPSLKRRFFTRSAPHFSPGKLAWNLRLEKSTEDRDRNGDPE